MHPRRAGHPFTDLDVEAAVAQTRIRNRQHTSPQTLPASAAATSARS
jgi:hypothetical protein